jgi:hypothetical protein
VTVTKKKGGCCKPLLSDELLASMIAEADFVRDIGAHCRRYGVSWATFNRWRNKAKEDDSPLKALVAEKRKLHDDVWEEGSKRTVRMLLMAIEHHAELALAMSEFAPDAIHKAAGALKILNDAAALRGALPALPNVQPPRGPRKDSTAPAPAGVVGGTGPSPVH